jgi:hypothetical protein
MSKGGCGDVKTRLNGGVCLGGIEVLRRKSLADEG